MTVKYQIRSRQTRWRASFKTLREARAHIKSDWGFANDPTVYILRIEEKIIR
jgi:hypothetical protein